MLTLSINQPPHVETSLLKATLQYRSGRTSWVEAQRICRSLSAHHHSGLAIIRKERELNHVNHLCAVSSTPCWIGLQRDEKDLNVWTWINNEAYNTIRWRAGQPKTQLAGENCVTVLFDSSTSSYLFDDFPCSSNLAFVCQRDNLVLVKQNKTWEEALYHCRALQVSHNFYDHPMLDLLSFHTEDESAYAQSIVREAQTDEAWIGLRFLAGRWLWMDGKTGDGVSSPVCPANGRNCGTLSEKGKQARSCVERRNFFCFQRPAPDL